MVANGICLQQGVRVCGRLPLRLASPAGCVKDPWTSCRLIELDRHPHVSIRRPPASDHPNRSEQAVKQVFDDRAEDGTLLAPMVRLRVQESVFRDERLNRGRRGL